MSKSEENGEDFAIDPDLKEELDGALSEESIIGMGMAGGKSEEKMPLVKEWFPDENKWEGKTIITANQATQLALAKHLPKAFPEIMPLEGFINDVINDYEMLLTSVEGVSREQQKETLISLFGGSSKTDKEGASHIEIAMGGGEEGD